MLQAVRKVSAILAIVLLAACSPTPPPADLLAIEATARKLVPQDEIALLYIFTTKDKFSGTVTVRLNKEYSLMGDLPGWFYAFCLPPGKHEIEYIGGGFFSAQKEFVVVKAGEIHVRDVQKNVIASLLLVLPGVINVDALDAERARPLLPVRRLGSDPFYINSKYRCRTLAD